MNHAVKYRRLLLPVIFLLFPALVFAIPQKPVPERLVNDFAEILSYAQRQSLEMVLAEFDDSTSNQIAVVTVLDLEGYTPSEYATRIGLNWGVGSGKFDNGIVVLVKPKTGNSQGQVNISVGYGLEGAIPDVYAKRIIENKMIPHFMQNDYYGGIAAACSTLMALASGEISEPREDGGDGFGILIIALILFGIILIIVGFIKAIGGKGGGHGGSGGSSGGSSGGPDLMDAFILGQLLGGSGRRNGGHFGGGGSFGGGGGFGRGGGGFGGFGGGRFGGGGASGSW